MSLPILCLDFDGVIHDYRKGWQDGSIYGELTDGFALWAEIARKYFKLVVHSSRCSEPEGLAAVQQWLADRGLDWLEVSPTKPPAFLTIDDRALLFSGRWDHFNPAMLRNFRPW